MPSPVLPSTSSLVLRLPFTQRHLQPLLSAPLLLSILLSNSPPPPPHTLSLSLFSHSITLTVIHIHPSPSQISLSTKLYLLPPLPPSLENPPTQGPLSLLSLPLHPPPLLSSLNLPPPILFLSSPSVHSLIATTALHHKATLLYVPASYLLRNSSLGPPLTSLLHIAKLTQPSVLLFNDAQLLFPSSDPSSAATFISTFLSPPVSRIAVILSQSHPDHPLHPYITTSIHHTLLPDPSHSTLSSISQVPPHDLQARWNRLIPSLGGLHHAKRILQRLLLWPRIKSSTLSRLQIKPPRAVLLYGVPGTGKTMLLSLAAQAAEYHVERLDAVLLARSEVGMSEKILRDAFVRAAERGFCVLFVDEIDALFVGGDRPHLVRLASVLGVLMDQYGDGNVVVVAATNRPWRVSARLMRAGRFENCVKVNVPARKERKEIGRVYAGKLELGGEVASCLEDLAAEKDGWTGADIAGACRKAVMRAASRGQGDVGKEHLVWAFGEVARSVTEEEVRRVEEWLPGK